MFLLNKQNYLVNSFDGDHTCFLTLNVRFCMTEWNSTNLDNIWHYFRTLNWIWNWLIHHDWSYSFEISTHQWLELLNYITHTNFYSPTLRSLPMLTVSNKLWTEYRSRLNWEGCILTNLLDINVYVHCSISLCLFWKLTGIICQLLLLRKAQICSSVSLP